MTGRTRFRAGTHHPWDMRCSRWRAVVPDAVPILDRPTLPFWVPCRRATDSRTDGFRGNPKDRHALLDDTGLPRCKRDVKCEPGVMPLLISSRACFRVVYRATVRDRVKRTERVAPSRVASRRRKLSKLFPRTRAPERTHRGRNLAAFIGTATVKSSIMINTKRILTSVPPQRQITN